MSATQNASAVSVFPSVEGNPRHVAIIMDGNNRWAKRHNLVGAAGHKAGVEAVRGVLDVCKKQGIEVLTLFAFSSENWRRPTPEVRALLALLMRYLRNEVDELHRDKVRIQFIGRRDRFSRRINALFERSESLTRGNSGSTLVIAVDYGGHWDIAGAARRLAERVKNGSLNPADITPELLGSHLSTGQLPPPDLCIRTGGDSRVSNFMLWQFAYTELFFTDTLWPDFNEQAFESALRDFRMRERRFGGRPGLDNNNA